MSISFIIPTHNRHDELARTLAILGAYDTALLGAAAEVIVIDNASDTPVRAPRALPNAVPVRTHRLDHNAGAAARNTAAKIASGDWLVMLDDDSAPIDGDFAHLASTAPPDLAAIGGEILLPDHTHESGGLPEVIIGCGCLIRRDAFLAVSGYDPSFNYYAEEYDLCAKLIARGHRITHTRAVRFEHRKVAANRSFDRIIARLVRNNAWTIARHAPDHLRDDALRATLERYRAIAIRERVEHGYNEGLNELHRTIDAQPRTPLSQSHWDRFIGLAACRAHLIPLLQQLQARTVALISGGKGEDLIEQVIREAQREIVTDSSPADARVIATLSPGPMLDALDQTDALAPWRLDSPSPAPLSVASTRTPACN